ncbi:MAG: iron-containing alcohol dehydrogenase [Spirochaetes bacterium]|nr:iron-containing alcohol dehydrogenase [Spirochaetota bacterium]
MAELNINIKSALASGRGKIEKFPGFLRKDCRRVVVVRDPDSSDHIASDISAILFKKGIDCVFFNDISSKSTSREAEALLDFIKKGFVQSVIGFGRPKVVSIARISAFAAENGLNIDDILDGTTQASAHSLKKSAGNIDYIEIPSSIRNPLMFTSFVSVTDSRSRIVKIIDIKKHPDLIIKDPSVFENLTKISVNSISFELLSIMLEVLVSREKHYFTNTLVTAPFIKLFNALNKEEYLSLDDYSDIALCSDYAYSIHGPGIVYYIALALNSIFRVPVSIVSAILLPHLVEYYSDFSPETIKSIIARVFDDQAVDIEDFVAMVRQMMKKRNLPMRFSEVDIKKDKLSNIISYLNQCPPMVKNSFNIEESRITSILHSAL